MSGSVPPPDVRFDHVAAAAAVDQTNRVLRLLNTWMTAQEEDVRAVLAGWSGASREQAVAALSVHVSRVSEIADRLGSLIVALEEAQFLARFEQTRRVAEQLEWDGSR